MAGVGAADGLAWKITYESDHVVTDTINEIQKTLQEGFLLLMAVVYLL